MGANFLDELLKASGGWGVPSVTQFDPMATDSRLGNGPQVEKEKNQLNALFQGAVFAGDLDKAARLAVTPEHQAMLDVAYGQRINDRDRRARQDAGYRVDAPTNLLANFQNAQYTNLMRGRAEEDRQAKMQTMNDASKMSQAHAKYYDAQTLNANAKEVAPPVKPVWDQERGVFVTPPSTGAAPTLTPVPGIEPNMKQKQLDVKQKNQFSTDKATLDTVQRTSKALIDNINQIIGSDEPGSDGKVSAEHSGMRGSVGYIDSKLFPFTGNQANAKALIKGLMDKTSVAGLQTLRQSGTAPGSITEKEWPIFQNYLGTIDPSQGEDQYREQLKALRIGAREMLQNTQRNFQDRHAGSGTTNQGATSSSTPSANVRVVNW